MPRESANDLTSAEARLPRRWLGHGIVFWAGIVAVCLISFVLRFAYFHFGDLANHNGPSTTARLLYEGSGALLALPPQVIFLAAIERYRPAQMTRPGAVVFYVTMFFVVTIVHTSLMGALRPPLFRLFGEGDSRYTLSWLRLAQEAPNELINYVSFIAVLALIASVEAGRARERRELELERSIARTELANLRLQLQPHFLFNALNTIASRMYDDPASADTMVGHVSDLLRHSLRTNTSQTVPFSEELAIAESYIAIMRARFGDALAINVNVASDACNAMVPSFLLQPLIENGVRHGAISTYGSGYVNVSARRADSTLHIEVTNDVSPSPLQAIAGTAGEREAGIGLSATASRLKLTFGDAHHFDASLHETEFRVVIDIPFISTSESDARTYS